VPVPLVTVIFWTSVHFPEPTFCWRVTVPERPLHLAHQLTVPRAVSWEVASRLESKVTRAHSVVRTSRVFEVSLPRTTRSSDTDVVGVMSRSSRPLAGTRTLPPLRSRHPDLVLRWMRTSSLERSPLRTSWIRAVTGSPERTFFALSVKPIQLRATLTLTALETFDPRLMRYDVVLVGLTLTFVLPRVIFTRRTSVQDPPLVRAWRVTLPSALLPERV